MSDQPRKHHYVPRFYLRGFTKDGTDVGDLFVLDKLKLKKWHRNPNDTAIERDFYRVELRAANDPMAVEKALGKLEGNWSRVLRQIIESNTLPKEESFGDLMLFVAFMAVRVRGIRDCISNWLEQVRRKEEFARQWLEEEGHKAVAPAPDRFAEFDQTWHVKEMLHQGTNLASWLCRRYWNLWVAEADAPDLICSDWPVAVNWTVPDRGPYIPGFGTPNTIVTVPLCRRMAMASVLETDIGPRRLDQKGVAYVNRLTMTNASRIYSAHADFAWMNDEADVGDLDELLHALTTETERGEVDAHVA